MLRFWYLIIWLYVVTHWLWQFSNANYTNQQRILYINWCKLYSILTTSSSASGGGVGNGGLSVTGGQTMKSIVIQNSIDSANVHQAIVQRYGRLFRSMVCRLTLINSQANNKQSMSLHTQTHTAFCPGLTGWTGTRKRHSPTHTWNVLLSYWILWGGGGGGR